MSTDASAEAKPEAPKGLLQKVGAALPVGLTALATAFAGMSTGALQQAMFWKSQAAQDQSRAANQWSYAGFKRDRALVMQTSAAQLWALSGYASPEFSIAGLPPLKLSPGEADVEAKRKMLADKQGQALKWLQEQTIPPSPLPDVADERIVALQKAIEMREPESELIKLAAKVPHDAINRALDETEKAIDRYDRERSQVMTAAAAIVVSADWETKAPTDPESRKRSTTQRIARQAAGFDLEEKRYRAESRLNQGLGSLYEVRVRVSSAESDKHRRKSELFFFAMLAAQVGATISALSLARRTRSVLWLFASLIGIASIGIGVYVFLLV